MGKHNFTVSGVQCVVNVRDEWIKYYNTVWNFNELAYSNDVTAYILGGGLVQFERESAKNYAARQKQCRFANYPKTTADTIAGHLFKKPATRTATKEGKTQESNALIEWTEKTDKAGKITMTELMKEVFLKGLVTGDAYVLIDKPDKDVNSKLEEKEAGMPYAYVIKPQYVVDWQKDDGGEYLYVKILETYYENPDDPLADHEIKVRFRIWTRTEWYLVDESDERMSGDATSGEHTLGVVPIVHYVNDKNMVDPDVGATELTQICQLSHVLFNKQSELDHNQRQTAFALLAIPTTAPGGRDADSDETATDKLDPTIMSGSVIYVDPESRHMPTFIEPSGQATGDYLKVGEDIVGQILHFAKIEFMGGVSSSGVEAAFKFEKTNTALMGKAESLKDAEYSILTIVGLWLDQPDLTDDIAIEYPKDFNIMDILRDLDAAFKTLELDISPTFDKEFKKTVAKKIMPNAADDTMAKIVIEIDTAGDFPPIEDEFDDEDDA